METCDTEVDVFTLDIALATQVMADENADLDGGNGRVHHLEMDMTPCLVGKLLTPRARIEGSKAFIS